VPERLAGVVRGSVGITIRGGCVDKVIIGRAGENGVDQGSILRLAAIDEPTLWAGISTVPGKASTGWHHHGTNTTVFYMLSGELVVEHGDDRERAVAATGDFVVVPAGVVHREIVPKGEDVTAVVIRFGDGSGPLVVEVDA
jgi:uncharacterized RmlC-like cupin family protein